MVVPVVEELFGGQRQSKTISSAEVLCCHARLAEQAQVAFMLHILCGFSVNEIANAFVSSDLADTTVVGLRAQKKLSGYL